MINKLKNKIVIGLSVFGLLIGSSCINGLTTYSCKESDKNEVTSVVCTESENKTDETINIKKDNKSKTVYITKTGKRYHEKGCKHLKKSSIPVNMDDAISNNYSPCKSCHK